jgi:hypothetical protein
MANPGQIKARGSVDKTIGKLRKQNLKLRKRIAKDIAKLSADAKVVVGLEERLRRLEAQIGDVTARVQGAGASARRVVLPTRKPASASAAASRTRGHSPRAASRASRARSVARTASARRRVSRVAPR